MSNIKFNIEEKLNRPVIALRGLWIYPYSVVHFDAGRKKVYRCNRVCVK